MRYVISGFDDCSWSFVGSADSIEQAEKIIQEDWENISEYYRDGYIVPESYSWRHNGSKRLFDSHQSKDTADIKEMEDRFCYQILDLENLDSYIN